MAQCDFILQVVKILVEGNEVRKTHWNSAAQQRKDQQITLSVSWYAIYGDDGGLYCP